MITYENKASKSSNWSIASILFVLRRYHWHFIFFFLLINRTLDKKKKKDTADRTQETHGSECANCGKL